MPTKEDIIKEISGVYDPEIPVNIVDLGFIYDVSVTDGDVKVIMTLTVPGCPMHQILTHQVEEVVKKLDGVNSVNIELTFEPRWSVERITEAGKEKLRSLGYKI